MATVVRRPVAVDEPERRALGDVGHEQVVTRLDDDLADRQPRLAVDDLAMDDRLASLPAQAQSGALLEPDALVLAALRMHEQHEPADREDQAYGAQPEDVDAAEQRLHVHEQDEAGEHDA